MNCKECIFCQKPQYICIICNINVDNIEKWAPVIMPKGCPYFKKIINNERNVRKLWLILITIILKRLEFGINMN